MSSRKRRATDEDVEPRVAATQSQSQLLFLRYGDRKPVVTLMKPSLSDIEQVARQFFECPANTRLKFYKKFGNELVQIDPAAWLHINEATTSLWIEAEEVSGSSRLVRQPAHSSFHIFVQSPSGQFRIKINANTTVAALKSAIENKVSIPVEDQRLAFSCMRLADCDTLVSCGVTQDSTLDLYPVERGGKPVIYLYPPTPISVNVTLSLDSASSLCTSHGETVSWDVFAEPGGVLRSSDGLEVSYLYWEAKTCIPQDIATPPASRPQGHSPVLKSPFDPSKPDLTPQNSAVLHVPANLAKYLDHALLALGLHTEARTSFITYWLPSFMKHEYIALRFLEQSLYNHAAHLDITPKPDIVTHVFMLFRGLTMDDLADWGEAVERADSEIDWRTIVGADVEGMQRENLFRVLEWGGMEVH